MYIFVIFVHICIYILYYSDSYIQMKFRIFFSHNDALISNRARNFK